MQEPGGRYTQAATKPLYSDLKDSMMISDDLNTGEETILEEKDYRIQTYFKLFLVVIDHTLSFKLGIDEIP